MRAAFRKLATLTPLAWGFFVGSLFLIGGGIPNAHGSTSFYYIVSRPNSSYMSQIDACSAAMDMNENSSGVPSDAINPRPSWDENGNCVVYYNVLNYNYGVSLAIVIDGGPATVRSKACKSGEPKTLTWPAGRYLTPGDETSFQDFGSSPPNPACFSGCSATRSGFSDNPYYSPENAQLIVQDYPYITDGAACAADTPAPEVPDFPSPPGEDDGGDTGGGDTGGGDTGGSTGGGDLGGGTTMPGGGDSSVGGGSGGGGGGNQPDPADPADPIDPTDPTDPAGPTDPADPGDASGPQDGATSADIRSLGDRITGAISSAYDRLASAISGVRNDLQGMNEAIEELSGPEWGADGGLDDGSGIGEMGGELGGGIVEGINTATDDAIASRDGELQEALDGIAGQVEDWFGDKGSKIDPDNLLGFLPREASCSDIPISVKLGREDANLVIPVCSLSSVKDILKWVFYALTIIGIWKILMNGMIVSARGGKGR